MTALDQYVRLESGGLWRESPDAQRREVVITFGDATLVISDKAGRPLAHWSLPAVTRQNPGEVPAIYTPDVDVHERVEIDDALMIDAIETIGAALEKERPKPGKLRHWMTAGLIAGSLLLAVFWLPGALMRQTLAVVPLPQRMEIGATILGHMQMQTGAACREPRGVGAAGHLAQRLFGAATPTQIVVVPELAQGAAPLPGGLIVLDHGLLQGSDDPAVAAGYVLAAHAARARTDPLEDILRHSGLGVTFRLLTTGDVPEEVLSATATRLVEAPWRDPEGDIIAAAFATAQVPSAPYAAVTGAEIGEQDAEFPAVMGDGDWVSLQNICAG